MAYCIAVRPPGGARTWTVIDSTFATVGPVEEWLEAHRLSWSPNTVRSFATALSQWWTFLQHRDEAEGWDRLGVPAMAAFVRWLHDGRHRETVPAVPMVASGAGGGLSVSTLEARLAAVTSFYRWQEAVHQVTVTHRLLKGVSRRAPARGLLAHLASRRPVVAARLVRVRRTRRSDR